MPQPTTAVHAALTYALRGWRVINLLPREKRPRGNEWQMRATTDPIIIESWYRDYPNDGVGIVLGPDSGIFVTDIDVHDAENSGWKTLTLEWIDHPGSEEWFLDTYSVDTPTGGAHYYWTYPELPDGYELPNGNIGPGIDIKANNGFVVAPPSIHPYGMEYRIRNEGPVLDAPRWVLERAMRKIGQPTERTPTATIPDLRFVDGTSASDKINQVPWRDILILAGWTYDKTRSDGEQLWIRPGKTNGAGATLYFDRNDALHVFTSSIPALPNERSYSRLQFIARWWHDGDESAAAKAIHAGDYTKPATTLRGIIENPTMPTIEETGWEPANPDEYTDPNYQPIQPTILARADGQGLFYKGRINAIYGESGSGKSWVASLAVAEALTNGRRAIYIDLEDHASSIWFRLNQLGVTREQVKSGFTYIQPNMPTSQFALELVDNLIDETTDVLVIDSLGEALAADGLNQNNDNEVTIWHKRVPHRWSNQGPAVILTDHVPKASNDNANNGFAIGSQRKRAAIDGVAYSIEQTQPIGKGETGKLQLKCTKDRNGVYRMKKVAADIVLDSDGYNITTRINIPDSASPDHGGEPATTKAPTYVMELISQFLVEHAEEYPRISSNKMEKEMTCRRDTTRAALSELVLLGHLEYDERFANKGGAYRLIRPYMGHSSPFAPTSPHFAPGEVEQPRPVAPISRRDGAMGEGRTSDPQPRPDSHGLLD